MPLRFGARRAAWGRLLSTPAPAPALSPVVYLVPSGSQSNQSGRTPQDNADPATTTDIFQFGGVNTVSATYRVISSSTRQMNHPDYYAGTSDRVSCNLEYLKAIRDQDPGCKVIAVPAADGAPLTTSAGGSSWASSPTIGAGGNKFEFMMDQLSRAYTAAAAAYPGATIKTILSWNGGEADAQVAATRASYRTALLALIDDFRTRAAAIGISGGSTAQVIICSQLPQLWIIGSADYNTTGPNGATTYAEVNAAEVDASVARSNVLFTPGPDVRGGNDTLHYQPAAVTRAQGVAIGAIRINTTQPNVTSAATYSNTNGRKLSFALTSDMTHATFHINGGTDAALFEISDQYITPTLRWVGDGTGPATNASYVVNVRARSGSGTYGPNRAMTITVAAVGTISPATFFTNGERGMVWDPTDTASVFQSVAGTTAPVATQPVGYVADKSPNANHWIAAADNTTRPTYQVDSDGKAYLSFDGSNDILFAATPFNTTSNVTITTSLGMYGASQTSKELLSANSITDSQPFILPFETSGADIKEYARSTGGSILSPVATLTGVLDSTKRVLTSFQGGTSQLNGMRNAASRPAGGGTKASGAYTSATASTTGGAAATTRSGLGGWSGSSAANFFAGRIYAGYVINRALTDAEIANAEDWIAARTLTTTLP